MKNHKRLFLFLLWLAAGSAAASLRAEVSTYFPLEKGNFWIYTPNRNSETFRTDVIRRTGNVVEVMSKQYTTIYSDRGSEIDIQLPKEGFLLFRRFIPNSTWDYQGVSNCNNGPVAVDTAKEPIVTRAGNFEKCLHLRFSKACSDGGLVEEWWAPNVGLVKWTQDNIAGLLTFELSEYGLQGSAAKAGLIRFLVRLNMTWRII